MRFRATKRDGRLRLAYPKRYQAFLKTQPDGEYAVSVRRWTQPRSLISNRYYFGAVVRTIGNELGYSDPDELHELLALKFLRIEDDPITGSPRRRRTRTMDQATFSAYVNQVITWAEADMGIRIARPEEWTG